MILTGAHAAGDGYRKSVLAHARRQPSLTSPKPSALTALIFADLKLRRAFLSFAHGQKQ